MDRTRREQLILQYIEGPAKLEAALAEVPDEARTWKPAPAEWSAHEIICHCADSETFSATRIRLLAAEPNPVIVGYEQEQWARYFDYHQQPLEPALALVRALRAQTGQLLQSLPDDVWSKIGTHTESGPYSAEEWLEIYARHLHDHADQVRANLDTWQRTSTS